MMRSLLTIPCFLWVLSRVFPYELLQETDESFGKLVVFRQIPICLGSSHPENGNPVLNRLLLSGFDGLDWWLSGSTNGAGTF